MQRHPARFCLFVLSTCLLTLPAWAESEFPFDYYPALPEPPRLGASLEPLPAGILGRVAAPELVPVLAADQPLPPPAFLAADGAAPAELDTLDQAGTLFRQLLPFDTMDPAARSALFAASLRRSLGIPCYLEPDSAAELFEARLVGGEGVYTSRPGDTLKLVGARLTVDWRELAKGNRIDPERKLLPGTQLAFVNRRIVPVLPGDGIWINLPERTLYFIQQGRLVAVFGVAVGLHYDRTGRSWHTPVKPFTITEKAKNPAWTVPPSIQAEMRAKGERVLTYVGPGPKNPLGKYAMKTSLKNIMLHSTSSPASIFTLASHGCLRIMPEFMESFFPLVKVGTKGAIIYQPVKALVLADGQVLLEAHRDVYQRLADYRAQAEAAIEAAGASELVDWDKVDVVLAEKKGIALPVGLAAAAAEPSE